MVRLAGLSDAAGIAEVHIRAWDTAYRGLISDEVIRSVGSRRLSFWTSYLSQTHEREYVLVASEDDRVVGFASARPSPDEDAQADQAEVSGLYVDPECWGRGIGGALLEALLEGLRADGFATATLWVLTDNAAARRFYERRDWTLDGAKRVDRDRKAPELRYRISLSKE